MISTVEGKGVGAGKSYYVATRMITHLAAGGTLYVSSNFGVEWPEMKALVAARYGLELQETQWNSFDAEDTFRLHELTPQGTPECPVLIVLDEAHMQLNARDWGDTKKRPFFLWLTQSRHDDCDLIFITQNANNIDKQIGRLVTYLVRVRNMENFSIPGLGKLPFGFSKRFLVNIFDGEGKILQERKWLKHDKGIFRVYNSKIMRGAHKRLGLVVPKLKLNKTRKNRMKLLPLVILACLGFGGYRMYQWKTGGGLNPAAVQPVAAQDKPKERAPLALPANVAHVDVDAVKPRPAYQIERQKLRGTDEKTYLRTDSETYRVGTMSTRGLVVGINGYVAKIATPSGETLFVLGGEENSPAGKAVPVASIVANDPPRTEPVGAKWEPRPSPVADAELARVRADLARPIGTPAAATSSAEGQKPFATRSGQRILPKGVSWGPQTPDWQKKAPELARE